MTWAANLILLAASLLGIYHEHAAPTPTALPVLPSPTPAPLEGDAAFSAGYLDHGGNPAWLAHFLYDVAPCEGGPAWGIGDYGNGYVSRLQFHPQSWATAVAHTGLSNPVDPYHVGANVAWWSNASDSPEGTGGWPHCWWVGDVPGGY